MEWSAAVSITDTFLSDSAIPTSCVQADKAIIDIDHLLAVFAGQKREPDLLESIRITSICRVVTRSPTICEDATPRWGLFILMG